MTACEDIEPGPGHPPELLAKDVLAAWFDYCHQEIRLVNFVLQAVGADPSKTETWPCDDVGFDPGDWDGQSIEIKQATPGWAPTPDQLQTLWRTGFNVVCIHYKESTRKRFIHPRG